MQAALEKKNASAGGKLEAKDEQQVKGAISSLVGDMQPKGSKLGGIGLGGLKGRAWRDDLLSESLRKQKKQMVDAKKYARRSPLI